MADFGNLYFLGSVDGALWLCQNYCASNMNFVWPPLAAFLLAVPLTFLTIAWAKRWGFVDDPRVHKHPALIHKRAIPRAGGLPIYLAVLVASFLILEPTWQILGIFLGGLILVVVGLIDDKRDLPSSVKLLAQILAAVVVVGSGVGVAFVTNPLAIIGVGESVVRLDSWRIVFNFLGEHSILVWADLFAIFWIVWVINMINFSSGVDGQMPGIVAVTLAILLAASLRFVTSDPQQLVVGQLALIGMGATLGFLIFNFYPAKIFPGDSGSYFLGYLVAVVAILSGAKVGAAILVMAVPLLDGVFTIVRRVIRRQSPFVGDRGHLHHRLLEIGWSQRSVALFYYSLCAILGAVALTLPAGGKIFAAVVVAVIVLGGLLWLNMNLPQKGLR